MFLAGLGVFTAASLACALAPGFGWLLAARAAQGVGAALLVPASLALLGAAFEGEARGRAVGTWAAAGAITGALGPLVGGWLVDAIGWRSIFLVNLPIAAVAAWLAWRKVDESRSRRSAAARRRRRAPRDGRSRPGDLRPDGRSPRAAARAQDRCDAAAGGARRRRRRAGRLRRRRGASRRARDDAARPLRHAQLRRRHAC